LVSSHERKIAEEGKTVRPCFDADEG